MSGPLISIVIPVYNVEKYLKKCLDSVINQTYKNIEIILVDDGSTDKSGNICDEYCSLDKRIQIIHKKNGGLSDARNCGIDIAHGNYITFIDSDDFVTLDYIEFLYNILIQYNADISICAHKNFYENKKDVKQLVQGSGETVFTGEEALAALCYQKQITNSACGKLYQVKLFENIKYPVGKLYEDLGTTYKLLDLSKKVVFCPDQKYYYLQRNSSIMHYKFSERKMDRIYISEELLNYVKQNRPEIVSAAISRLFISSIQVLREFPFSDLNYTHYKEIIIRNIKAYRFTVLTDKNAKKINRIIALSTYFNLRGVQQLGKIYKFIFRN